MQRAESVRVARPLFHGEGSGSTPTSALSLWFETCPIAKARQLVRLWHSRLPNMGGGGCRVCYTAESEGLYYAVAVWTNPSAPNLPQQAWLELKRMAIAPDAPKNTASRMMGWMERDIRKRFPLVTTLVSYRDCEVHAGTIYKAAGWLGEDEQRRSPSTTWHNRGKARTINNLPRVVQRWTKRVYPLEGESGGTERLVS